MPRLREIHAEIGGGDGRPRVAAARPCRAQDMVMSLYLSAVVGAGYQLTPEDAQVALVLLSL